jgi:hypothetical protein
MGSRHHEWVAIEPSPALGARYTAALNRIKGKRPTLERNTHVADSLGSFNNNPQFMVSYYNESRAEQSSAMMTGTEEPWTDYAPLDIVLDLTTPEFAYYRFAIGQGAAFLKSDSIILRYYVGGDDIWTAFHSLQKNPDGYGVRYDRIPDRESNQTIKLIVPRFDANGVPTGIEIYR